MTKHPRGRERGAQALDVQPGAGMTSLCTEYSLGVEHKILQLREALWAAPEFPETMARLESLAAVKGSLGVDGLDPASQSEPPVQMKNGSGSPEDAQAVAAYGIRSSGERLPYFERIQAAFGEHDVTTVRAHVGGPASVATRALGASAYATGSHVAFASSPDLHTAAHEAAHVVQQRQGVQLSGGVGRAGDPYERHADAVADRVVRGESASDLLGSVSSMGGAAAHSAVQRKEDACPRPEARVAPLSTVHKHIRDASEAIGGAAFWTSLLEQYIELAASYAAGVTTQEQLAEAGHHELAAALSSEKRDALVGQLTSLALSLPSGVSALVAAARAIRSNTLASAMSQAKAALSTAGGLEQAANAGDTAVNAKEALAAAGGQVGFSDAVLQNIRRIDERLRLVEQFAMASLLLTMQGHVHTLRTLLFATTPSLLMAVQEAVAGAIACEAYSAEEFQEIAAAQGAVAEQLAQMEPATQRFLLLANGFQLTGASGDLARPKEGSNPNRDLFDLLTELHVKGASRPLAATITRDVELSGTTPLGTMTFANVHVHPCSFDLAGLEAAVAAAGLEMPKKIPTSSAGALPPQPGVIRLDAGVGRTLVQFAGGGIQWRMRFFLNGAPVVVPLFPDSQWYLSNDFLALARTALASSWGTYPHAHRLHLFDTRQGQAFIIDSRAQTVLGYPDSGGSVPDLNPDQSVAR